MSSRSEPKQFNDIICKDNFRIPVNEETAHDTRLGGGYFYILSTIDKLQKKYHPINKQITYDANKHILYDKTLRACVANFCERRSEGSEENIPMQPCSMLQLLADPKQSMGKKYYMAEHGLQKLAKKESVF